MQQRSLSPAAPELQPQEWPPKILRPGSELPWRLSAACRPGNGAGTSCCEPSARFVAVPKPTRMSGATWL